MKSLINYRIKVLTTGFIILTLFSILLFWCRFFCIAVLFETTPGGDISLELKPSELLPSEIEYDPNISTKSNVSASMRPNNFMSQGIADYFLTRSPGGCRSKVYYFRSDDNYMYLDEKTNQIICHSTYLEKFSEQRATIHEVHLYIGPEGVSEIPNQDIGRFIDPIMDRNGFPWSNKEPQTLILYDKSLCRFFKIDFDQKTIVKGPEIKKDDRHRPIQIGQLNKNPFYSGKLEWESPTARFNYGEKNIPLENLTEIEMWYYIDIDGPYLLVLDETGRIDLLVRATLDFVGTAGWLTIPDKHGSSKFEPEDFLCYDVKPFFIWPDISEDTFASEYKKKIEAIISQKAPLPKPPESESEFLNMDSEDNQPENNSFGENPRSRSYRYQSTDWEWMSYYSRPTTRRESNSHVIFDLFRKGNINDHPYIYKGALVSCLSRDGTMMALAVFNKKGNEIRRWNTKSVQHGTVFSSRRGSSSFEAPWASSLVIGEYLAENLHPPILSVLTYFTADSFEAGSGQRALFILPNSFMAMLARDTGMKVIEKIIMSILIILPSIIISLFLAWLIRKDAKRVGISEKAKLFWIVGTISFGLAGYITYRLIRPKTALVTCQNCGKPRRPDMDRCHRCKSKWHVPELIPPAWRVVD